MMDGVDTNVENYTSNDLFEILGLDQDSSPELIRNNADTMIARMTSEGKPEIALFLENVKKRLLNESAKQTNSISEDDEEDEDEDEDEEDESDEEDDDTMDEKSTVERKKNQTNEDIKTDEYLANSFFNQERTKNVTQVISFDTRFRPNYYGTTSTSFTIDLPEVQKKVVSMRIASIEMPMTHYSVSPRLENNSMLVICEDTSYNTDYSLNNASVDYDYMNGETATNFHLEAHKKAWLVKLADGNYDSTWSSDTRLSRTENMVNDALSFATPGAINEKGKFAKFRDPSNNYLNGINVIDKKETTKTTDISFTYNNITGIAVTKSETTSRNNPNGDLRYTIDRISKKSVFAGGRNNTSYTEASANLLQISALRFNVDENGNLDTNANIQTKLGWTLGFRGAEYILAEQSSMGTTTAVSAVSEGIPFLSGTRYAFLSINDYQNNARPSFLVAYGDSTKTDNIMARINLSYGQNLHQRDSGFTHNSNRTREYFGPVDIQRLTIELKDEFGRIIDLNNMDWSFTLAFEKKFN